MATVHGNESKRTLHSFSNFKSFTYLEFHIELDFKSGHTLVLKHKRTEQTCVVRYILK